MSLPMDREGALALLKKYITSESLQRHCYSVEAAMRHFAALHGEDEEYWGMVGLLHDLDFELHPDDHCDKTPEFLREAGFDEAFIRAVLSHGYGLRESCSHCEPALFMEKTLYTVDELTGFVTAVTLMRPSRSLYDLEVKSVIKKFKQASFAAKINREIILDGCARMGMELDAVTAQVIDALKPISGVLGLSEA